MKHVLMAKNQTNVEDFVLVEPFRFVRFSAPSESKLMGTNCKLEIASTKLYARVVIELFWSNVLPPMLATKELLKPPSRPTQAVECRKNCYIVYLTRVRTAWRN